MPISQLGLPWQGRTPGARHASWTGAEAAAKGRKAKTARYISVVRAAGETGLTDHLAAERTGLPLQSINSIRNSLGPLVVDAKNPERIERPDARDTAHAVEVEREDLTDMAWVRIDDQAPRNHKMLMAGPAACWLWVCGIAHAQSQLTDGFISDKSLPFIGVPGNVKALAKKLVEVGLFELAEGGYKVHDYHDFNASADEVRAELEWDRRRKALYSDRDLIEFIKTRDRNCCRYCGVPVNWQDRRGPRGGQFDHIIARGANTAENIVVACRGCNIRKGNRSLNECGMTLIPADGNQSGPSSNLAHIPSNPIQSDPIRTAPLVPQQPLTRRPQKFGRITLHRWQLDELIAVLGPNAESFDLDEWVSRLSSLADQQRAYLPDRDAVWAWVQAELRQECQRRGLLAAGASSAGGGIEAIRAEIARQEAEARR